MTSYRDIGQDFEFEFDIGDLLEYENPALASIGLSTTPKASYVVLEGFKRDSVSIPKGYENILLRVAHLLVAAQVLNMPSEVALMGYPDAPKSDQATQNFTFNRAAAVRTKLQALMNGIVKDSAKKTTFNIYVNTAEHAGRTKSVDVLLPRTCQIFFADLDQQSFDHRVIGVWAYPPIKNKQERLENVLFVGQELRARLLKRAELALSGKPMPEQEKELSRANRETIKKGIRDMSAVQLNLFKKYYPKYESFDQDALMSCFLKFANGELRSPHSFFDSGENAGREIFGVGEPDSNHLFYFAEFALLYLEWAKPSDPLSAEWARALPALVAAQEVFIYIYREGRKSPPPPDVYAWPPPATVAEPARMTHGLDKFGAKHFTPINGSQTKGEGQSDANRLAALKDKYSKMRTTEQLRIAFSSNLLRAQTLT